MVENCTFSETKAEILKPLPLVRGEVGEGFYISQSLMHSQYNFLSASIIFQIGMTFRYSARLI
jgi:hypothetical protein